KYYRQVWPSARFNLHTTQHDTGQEDRGQDQKKDKSMVEWDKMRQEISESPQFKNRTRLNTETGEVTVTGVTKADSGLYTAEFSIGGQIKTFTQQVRVIDPVCNTSISCNKTGSTVTLVCEADGHLLSYNWTGPGLQNPENRSQIQISRENLGSNYTCVVKNPVSEEKPELHSCRLDCTITFPLHPLHVWYKSQSCHLQNFSDDSAIVGCIRDGQEEEYRKVLSGVS
uniref:Ig-like domain-containing protein n=1 Tax=Denticeps clupeoides TaxID=299321 RepID=A0AAY4ETZ2_9TELE